MTTVPSPVTDALIARKYGAETLEQKTHNKVALQESLGWPAEPKRAMICIPTGISDALGGALLKEVLPGLMELPISLVILGKGSSSYGALLTQMAKEQSHKIAIISNDEKSVHTMFAAADMALFLTDAAELPELPIALRYGTIPIAPANKILKNYDPNQENGDAFTFEKRNAWHCFAAVVRALETYRFPFDWKTIQRQGMEK